MLLKYITYASAFAAMMPGAISVMTRSEAMSFMNLADGFSDADLNTSFQRMAFEMHPEKGGSNESFQQLNEAFNTLVEIPQMPEIDELMGPSENDESMVPLQQGYISLSQLIKLSKREESKVNVKLADGSVIRVDITPDLVGGVKLLTQKSQYAASNKRVAIHVLSGEDDEDVNFHNVEHVKGTMGDLVIKITDYVTTGYNCFDARLPDHFNRKKVEFRMDSSGCPESIGDSAGPCMKVNDLGLRFFQLESNADFSRGALYVLFVR